MKYLLTILLFASSSYAQDVKTDKGNDEPVLGYIDCETKDGFKKISDFVKMLKSGEAINPDDLVNNPNFLSPCFKEQAGNYQTSFYSLEQLNKSIIDYKESESKSIEKTNDINEKLGTKRVPPKSTNKLSAKTSAPKKIYAPRYSSAFSDFKKKAKLVGTIKNEDGYLAMLTVGSLPFNDVRVGQEFSGVKVVEIGYGFFKYKDLGAAGKTGVLSVGQ